jgi:hypothetical protein
MWVAVSCLFSAAPGLVAFHEISRRALRVRFGQHIAILHNLIESRVRFSTVITARFYHS